MVLELRDDSETRAEGGERVAVPASLEEGGAAVLQEETVQPELGEEGRRELEEEEDEQWQEIVTADSCQLEVSTACRHREWMLLMGCWNLPHMTEN